MLCGTGPWARLEVRRGGHVQCLDEQVASLQGSAHAWEEEAVSCGKETEGLIPLGRGRSRMGVEENSRWALTNRK